MTLAVLISAAVAVEPIRDASTLGVVPEANLDRSAGYLALAPLSNVLDVLTLFGVRQHIALLVWLIVLYVLMRLWRRRRAPRELGTGVIDPPGGPARVAMREGAYAALFVLVVVATYAVAALAPRPMAALALTPADLYLSVDFHAHTRFSHDGRPGWEPSDVRAWHRAGGFDAAFISDHRTVEGAEQGIADNPSQAGQGTVLLQAIELGWRGEHVNVIGAERVYRGLTTADRRDIDEQALALASLLREREPVVIETIPGHPERVVAAAGPATAGVRAIELVDGAPRGLDQSRLQRTRILRLADSAGLALVAGSDNHGWGRTVPAWTLMRSPGWRGMSGDSLVFAIEHALRGGKGATRIVERRVAGEMNGPNIVELSLTLPLVLWRMLTTLSPDERVMWIVWACGLAIVAQLAERWRLRRLGVA